MSQIPSVLGTNRILWALIPDYLAAERLLLFI